MGEGGLFNDVLNCLWYYPIVCQSKYTYCCRHPIVYWVWKFIERRCQNQDTGLHLRYGRNVRLLSIPNKCQSMNEGGGGGGNRKDHEYKMWRKYWDKLVNFRTFYTPFHNPSYTLIVLFLCPFNNREATFKNACDVGQPTIRNTSYSEHPVTLTS